MIQRYIDFIEEPITKKQLDFINQMLEYTHINEDTTNIVNWTKRRAIAFISKYMPQYKVDFELANYSPEAMQDIDWCK